MITFIPPPWNNNWQYLSKRGGTESDLLNRKRVDPLLLCGGYPATPVVSAPQGSCYQEIGFISQAVTFFCSRDRRTRNNTVRNVSTLYNKSAVETCIPILSVHVWVFQTFSLPVIDTSEATEWDKQYAMQSHHCLHSCMQVLTRKTAVEMFTAVPYYFSKY